MNKSGEIMVHNTSKTFYICNKMIILLQINYLCCSILLPTEQKYVRDY